MSTAYVTMAQMAVGDEVAGPGSSEAQTGNGWRSWILWVLAGPMIHLILSLIVPFKNKGTSPFDMIMLSETGLSGLVVYYFLPWFILGSSVAAGVAWRRNGPCSLYLRWLAAPGFGLQCALFLSFVPYGALSMFADPPGYMIRTYGANLLPFLVFLGGERFTRQCINHSPPWIAALSVALLASYAMTYALVYPHVANYLSWGKGG